MPGVVLADSGSRRDGRRSALGSWEEVEAVPKLHPAGSAFRETRVHVRKEIRTRMFTAKCL